MMYLIFVNGLGPDYKGDNLYEFIFSDQIEVWGERWESKPCSSYPLPPDLNHIKKVGVLKNTDIKLELIQNSDYFSMEDAIDDVVSLAWENESESSKRLVFRFGETESVIKDKLYERDLILEFDKKVVYEK